MDILRSVGLVAVQIIHLAERGRVAGVFRRRMLGSDGIIRVGG